MEKQHTKIYNPLGRVLRWLYVKCRPGWTVQCKEALPPQAVYLVHHQNMAGPVNAVAYLPVDVRIWALEPFLNQRQCFEQFYNYTFTQRFKWPRPFAYAAAGLLSLVVPPVVRGLGAIPVYRGGVGSLTTMRASVQDLANGESILLCPDTNYDDDSPELGQVYTGFLLLERMYHKKTGRHLPFVPTYYSLRTKQFVVGRSLCFEDGVPFRQQMDAMSVKLRNAINDLGREAGDLPARAIPGTQVAE